jgi:hypothetical protein
MVHEKKALTTPYDDHEAFAGEVVPETTVVRTEIQTVRQRPMTRSHMPKKKAGKNRPVLPQKNVAELHQRIMLTYEALLASLPVRIASAEDQP